MSEHAHAHAAGHLAPASRPARLKIALAAAVFVCVMEAAGGLYAGSLALLADAAHVFTDVVALVIAIVASVQALRPATARRTYGYARFEILAALLNGGLLFAVTIAIAVEAVQRLFHPAVPQGGVMLAVAGAGLAINLAVGLMLARDAADDLNSKAVLLHVASDALGGVAVIVAAVVILTLGYAWVDPVLSLVVAAIILTGTVHVVKEAADVLLQSAPGHASIAAVATRMRAIPGVRGVHDLHVWTIASAKHVLTAHVLLDDKRISEATAVLRAIETSMEHEFSISHVTVQFECETCAAGDLIVCTQSR